MQLDKDLIQALLKHPEFREGIRGVIIDCLVAPAPSDEWMGTSKACTVLSMANATALLRWRKSMGQNCKEGVHYRQTGNVNSQRPNYEWHIENCKALQNEERRKLLG